VLSPWGNPIGKLSITDLQRGRITADHESPDRHAAWRSAIKCDLLVSRDPGLLERFGHPTNDNQWDATVIAPILVMFETWNICQAIRAMHDQLNDDDQFSVWMDHAGTLVDLSVRDALLVHVRAAKRRAARKKSARKILEHPLAREGGIFSGRLGAAADAWSAYPSARDIIAPFHPHQDAASGPASQPTVFGSGSLSFAAWSHALFAGKRALPCLAEISCSAFSWISLGTALAGLALLVFRFDEESPLAEWLAHGPFSRDAQNPPRRIGPPIDEPDAVDPSPTRFAGHRPGDVDWGPPAGGERKTLKYPGSCKMMEFWKEPDGSFLWIDGQGTLVDWHIKAGGRLQLNDGRLYLHLPGETVRLGGMFHHIQNHHRLLVDRNDSGDRFRDWCERPGTAYASLTAALFYPQIEVRLTKARTIQHPGSYRERTFHAANPIEGFVHIAHIQVAMPHFIPGRSRLYIQMWHQHGQGPDTLPRLTYADNIVLQTDPRRPLRQITLHWPFDWHGAQRETWVIVKCRLDLNGDGSLCLPLNPKGLSGDPDAWTIVKTLANRETMPERKH